MIHIHLDRYYNEIYANFNYHNKKNTLLSTKINFLLISFFNKNEKLFFPKLSMNFLFFQNLWKRER